MVALTSNGKEALDSVVVDLAERRKIPGFVLGATNSEGEIYFNSGGYKVLDDPESGTIDQDAIFWVCSMTKLITHIAALQLVEEGKLKVEDAVSDYFPQFLNTIVIDDITAPNLTFKPAKETVRVKHLLNFSSGLYYPPIMTGGLELPVAYCGPQNKEDPHSEFFALVQGDLPGIPVQYEPGTNFAYGFSSDVLGFIVEKISGLTLDQYMQENIFKPLDLKASFYLTPEVEERLFPLYLKNQDGKLNLWNYQPETRVPERDPTKVFRHLGGGGLYISLRNYLKLLRHILQIHDGKAQNPVISRDTIKKMFIGTLTEAGSESLSNFVSFLTPEKGLTWSNACALTTVDWPGSCKKGTGSWSGWAGTHFFIDPTTGIAGVYGTQITSLYSGAGDADALQGLFEFQKALYAGLDS